MEYIDELKQDLYGILARHPRAAEYLLKAIDTGHVNGNTWLSLSAPQRVSRSGTILTGRCGCVIGWAAASEGWRVLDRGDVFDGRSIVHAFTYPIENFIRDVRPGDLPSDTPELALLRDWVVEFMAKTGHE